jgi:hypothetical protein
VNVDRRPLGVFVVDREGNGALVDGSDSTNGAGIIPQLDVPELLIIMVIILVLGVGKLPQIGKALG